MDAGTHKIEAMQPDGSSRTVILTDPAAHFFAVSPYQQYLYYTDWNREWIHSYIYVVLLIATWVALCRFYLSFSAFIFQNSNEGQQRWQRTDTNRTPWVPTAGGHQGPQIRIWNTRWGFPISELQRDPRCVIHKEGQKLKNRNCSDMKNLVKGWNL